MGKNFYTNCECWGGPRSINNHFNLNIIVIWSA